MTFLEKDVFGKKVLKEQAVGTDKLIRFSLVSLTIRKVQLPLICTPDEQSRVLPFFCYIILLMFSHSTTYIKKLYQVYKS